MPGACGGEARKPEEEVRAGGMRTSPVGSGREGGEGPAKMLRSLVSSVQFDNGTLSSKLIAERVNGNLDT